MAKFNLEDYSTVEERLELYAKDYPEYRVETELLYFSDQANVVIIKASIFKGADDVERPHATGIAEETRDTELQETKNGKKYASVNYTSHVENCETSAIGRALANAGYTGTGKRPSREEMEKVQRKQKDVPEKKETKEEPPFEIDEPKKKSNGSIEDKLDNFNDHFDNMEEFVMWFNDLDNREDYLERAQEIIAELNS